MADPEGPPDGDVDAWQAAMGCGSRDAAARDLLVTGLAVALASHPDLRDELVLRGGLPLHRLVLPAPMRCCAALEYSRRSATPIGPLLDAVRDVAVSSGLTARTEVRTLPRVYLTPSGKSAGAHTRLRVDLETRETTPMRPCVRRPLAIATSWITGAATPLTYDTEELVGLALRELYRRSRSRDLFDVWVALTRLDIDDAVVVSAFHHACDLARIGRVSRGQFVARLHRHLARPTYLRDLAGLVAGSAPDFEPEPAATLVTRRLLVRLRP